YIHVEEAAQSPDLAEFNAAVQQEKTRLLYRTRVPMLVNLIIASIVAFVLRGTQPAWVILLWVALFYTVIALRLLNRRMYQREFRTAETAEAWARRFALGACATGVLWGLAGLAVLVVPNLYYVLFVAFVIGGMTAGTIAVSSVYLPALFAFMIPTILPMAIAFLVEGTAISIAMGLMIVVFTAALGMLGRGINETLVHNFQLHAELRSAKVVLEREIRNRERTEKELVYLNRHDPLTGLSNSATFIEYMALEIARARRGGAKFAVHFLDLDHFKNVNDTFGHQVGDRLLKAVADRLAKNVRQIDLVTRLGGDEFAILQTGISEPPHAESLARKLLDRLSATFRVNGQDIQVATSIGIAIYGADSVDPEAILKQADFAMYRAKAEGGNCYRLYSGDHAAHGGT